MLTINGMSWNMIHPKSETNKSVITDTLDMNKAKTVPKQQRTTPIKMKYIFPFN